MTELRISKGKIEAKLKQN